MDERPVAPPSKPTRVWPFVVVILLVVGAFVAWRVAQQPRGAEEAVPAADAGAPVAGVDAGPPRSVDDGDALLRKLAGPWSAEALFAQWLQGASLRHLVAATQLVAEGSSPRPALPFLSISGAFMVREERGPPPPVRKGKKGPPPPPREERFFISGENSARYALITKAFGSIDAAAAGEAWSRLEPYCEVAFGEISRPGTRFHDTLLRAVKRVLSVQVPAGEIELVPKGAIYLFKDPALESLGGAEKQLIRLGPENAKVIQDQLRLFATHAHLE